MIDKNGIIVIPLKYDAIKNQYKYYEVIKSNKSGIYSDDFKLVSNPIWDDVFSDSHNRFVVKEDTLFGALWFNSKTAQTELIIPVKYKRLNLRSAYHFEEYSDPKNTLYFDSIGNMMDKSSFQIYITDCEKNENYDGDEDYAVYDNRYSVNKIVNTSGNTYIITRVIYDNEFSRHNKVIVDTISQYDEIIEDNILKNVIPVTVNGKWGAVTCKNELIIPIVYDSVIVCFVSWIKKDWYQIIVKSNDAYELLDNKGNSMIEGKFNNITNNWWNFFEISNGNLIGLFYPDNQNTTLKFKYKSVNQVFDTGTYQYIQVTTAEGKIGYIDKTGREFFK